MVVAATGTSKSESEPVVARRHGRLTRQRPFFRLLSNGFVRQMPLQRASAEDLASVWRSHGTWWSSMAERFARRAWGRDWAQRSAAAAAVDRLSTGGFSVLISDVAMPVEAGYSLIARVRATEAGRARIPAIAVTGFARAEDRTRALAAGFQQCLSTPIDPMELVASVAALAQAVP
jgi:CheY-like chemotaxis protein